MLLCSFVRVIPPFCVNYLLPTYLHQRLFLMPALFRLLSSLVERGLISRCHSRIIYTSQVRGFICSEAVGPKLAEARGFLAEASSLA